MDQGKCTLPHDTGNYLFKVSIDITFKDHGYKNWANEWSSQISKNVLPYSRKFGGGKFGGGKFGESFMICQTETIQISTYH